jgi:hypothetical protein
VGDPVASHDRGRVLQPQPLGQAAGGKERAAGAEDHRDLVDDHLVDQPELERLAADLTGGDVDVPVEQRLDIVVSSAMNPSRETAAPMIVLPMIASFQLSEALAAAGGSANAIAFPSGSGTFTWRTPFE